MTVMADDARNAPRSRFGVDHERGAVAGYEEHGGAVPPGELGPRPAPGGKGERPARRYGRPRRVR